MVADLFALKKYRYSSTGAVSQTITPGQDARLYSVTVSVSTAPTTSESLTITVNYPEGGEYSTLMLSTDLSTDSTTDILYQPDAPFYILKGSSLTIAYANTDANTVAMQTVMEVEQ